MMHLTTRAGIRSALALAALASPSLAFAQESAPEAEVAEAPEASETTVQCTCTCTVCIKLHGPKANADRAEATEEALSVLEQLDAVLQDGTAGAEDEVEGQAEPEKQGEPGYMGVFLGASDEGVATQRIVPNSPAAAAGVQAGDVILAVEEMPVDSVAELQGVLRELSAGDEVTLELLRDDEEMTLTFALGSRAVLQGTPAVPAPPPVPEVEVLRGLGYGGDAEEPDEVDEPIVLPDVVGELVEVEDDVPTAPAEAPAGTDAAAAPSTGTFTVDRSSNALPPGYVEIETRRERRPAGTESNAALRERIQRLEREVAELQEMVEVLQAELRRRNPR